MRGGGGGLATTTGDALSFGFAVSRRAPRRMYLCGTAKGQYGRKATTGQGPFQ